MVTQKVKKVIKSSHLATEECRWGGFDRFSFIPYTDMAVRCTKCSNMMASDFFDESECPNCHWKFSKSDARDMYVESYAIKVNFKGWNQELLEIAQRHEQPILIAPDYSVHILDDVSRNLVAFSVQALREAERRRLAQLKLIDQIRSQHPLSKL